MRPFSLLFVTGRPFAGMCAALLAVCVFSTQLAAAGDIPGEGDTLPSLQIIAPASKGEQQYLGVPAQGVFGVEDIAGKLVVLELVGVYCPYCHKQAPLFNSLYNRLQRSGLGDTVKMLALASGATAPEVEQLRKHSRYAYPVVRDEDFSVHRALGEPKTPYTLVVDKEGTILYAKLGVVEDIDAFFATLKDLAS